MSTKKADTQPDPFELLQSLSVESLEANLAEAIANRDQVVAELQKKIDATQVLLNAARILRDGIPPKAPRVYTKREKGNATEKPNPKELRATAAKEAGGEGTLKVRIVKYLRTAGAARNAQIAEDLQTTIDAVDTIVRHDAAFECYGPGYWRLVA